MYGSYNYHSIIRKILVLFGDMFNDIQVARRTADGGTTNQRVVPLAYAPRQKFLARLQERADLTADRVQITLPRMSYEISGALIYDSQRQVGRNQVCEIRNANGDLVTVYSPAPYSLPIELNIYAKNQDEALQVTEQILPYFKPSITRRYMPFNGESWPAEVLFTLNSVNIRDNFEGEFKDQRELIYTLSFEAKFDMYGRLDQANSIIKTAIVNFVDSDGDTFIRKTVSVDPEDAGPEDDYTILEVTEDWLDLIDIPEGP